jgi:hypothetical protein
MISGEMRLPSIRNRPIVGPRSEKYSGAGDPGLKNSTPSIQSMRARCVWPYMTAWTSVSKRFARSNNLVLDARPRRASGSLLVCQTQRDASESSRASRRQGPVCRPQYVAISPHGDDGRHRFQLRDRGGVADVAGMQDCLDLVFRQELQGTWRDLGQPVGDVRIGDHTDDPGHLIGSATRKDGERRVHNQDLDVPAEREAANVLCVQTNTLGGRQVRPTGYLPQAGDPGFDR